MTIHFMQPPADAQAALHVGLKSVAQARSVTSNVLLAARRSDAPADGIPHPIYTLDLQDIIKAQTLSGARLIGWRYLVGDAHSTPLAAEVHSHASQHTFAGINEGPFTNQTRITLDMVEKNPLVQSGNYELRVLRIPALFVMALWLKDISGNNDLIVPMAPTFTGIEAQHTYPVAEFMGLLHTAAQTRTFDDTPQQP